MPPKFSTPKTDHTEQPLFADHHAPTAVPDGGADRLYRNTGDGLSEVSEKHSAPAVTIGSGWSADVGRSAKPSGSPGMPGAERPRAGSRPTSRGNYLTRGKK